MTQVHFAPQIFVFCHLLSTAAGCFYTNKALLGHLNHLHYQLSMNMHHCTSFVSAKLFGPLWTSEDLKKFPVLPFSIECSSRHRTDNCYQRQKMKTDTYAQNHRLYPGEDSSGEKICSRSKGHSVSMQENRLWEQRGKTLAN